MMTDFDETTVDNREDKEFELLTPSQRTIDPTEAGEDLVAFGFRHEDYINKRHRVTNTQVVLLRRTL